MVEVLLGPLRTSISPPAHLGVARAIANAYPALHLSSRKGLPTQSLPQRVVTLSGMPERDSKLIKKSTHDFPAHLVHPCAAQRREKIDLSAGLGANRFCRSTKWWIGRIVSVVRFSQELQPIAAKERNTRRASDWKTWWPGTELNRRRQPFQGWLLP